MTKFEERLAKTTINPQFYGKLVIAPDCSIEVVNLKNGVRRYRLKSTYPQKRILGLKVSIVRRLINKMIRDNSEIILTVGKTYVDVIQQKDLANLKI